MASRKDKLAGTKIKAEPVKEPEVGIDRDDALIRKIVDGIDSGSLDTSPLENLLTVSQSRESVYELIDSMTNDSDISSVIETYTNDTCERNSAGDIVWAESTDTECLKYVNYLLDSIGVNKHIRGWAHSLIKYGDLFWKLFRDSDIERDKKLFSNLEKESRRLNEGLSDFCTEEELNKEGKLNEDIQINYHRPEDHFVHYVEAVRNPVEMYELTKFGKTMGYIKAPTNVINMNQNQDSTANYYYQYRIKQGDIQIYQPEDFVHACLDDTSSRVPEVIDIFPDDESLNSGDGGYSYSVRRGQSLLYNSYKVWRELKLLETSVLLNRLTRSSVIRVLEIEVGDMSKAAIKNTIANVKQMVEQKSAINTGTSMSEYSMPGPIENTIYVPTHGEIGKINIQELGAGEVDPKSLADLDYFNNKLYGSLRVPKAFFNFTDDGAGFNGGSSLAIISSRYGKEIKWIQSVLCQGITDIINIFLLDKGLNNYINKFTIKMQQPVTQEEIDRREATQNEIGVIRDLMQIISDSVDDSVIRLKCLKELIASSSQPAELIPLLQEQIDLIASGEETDDNEESEDIDFGNESGNELAPEDNTGIDRLPMESGEEEIGELESGEETGSEEAPESGEDYLPSFEEMGVEDGTNL